ncbi:MAG: hypothetical protein R2766_07580 [Saprospiraceae bacterium]
MKNLYILFILALAGNSLYSQCDGELKIQTNSQSALDSLITLYSTCDSLSSVDVYGTDITDISGLANFAIIKKFSAIGTHLKDFNALENTSVYSITIQDNALLSPKIVLPESNRVESFIFTNNSTDTVLINMAGQVGVFRFDNEDIGNYLYVKNESLKPMSIKNYYQDGDIYYDAVTKPKVTDKFWVSDVSHYPNVAALPVRSDTLGEFYITSGSTDFDMSGIHNFKKIGLLTLRNIPSVDFKALREADVEIENLDLASISQGLDDVSEIADVNMKGLYLYNLTNITNLNGLGNISNLSAIGLFDLPALTDINKLMEVQVIDPDNPFYYGLKIIDCPQLSSCAIKPICEYLEGDINVFFTEISNNGEGCNSVEEIQMACLSSSDDLDNFDKTIRIYPNPVSRFCFHPVAS